MLTAMLLIELGFDINPTMNWIWAELALILLGLWKGPRIYIRHEFAIAAVVIVFFLGYLSR